nr:hypothetical protein RVX_2626 [Nitratidesulfovibrio sp. HK-II]
MVVGLPQARYVSAVRPVSAGALRAESVFLGRAALALDFRCSRTPVQRCFRHPYDSRVALVQRLPISARKSRAALPGHKNS